VSPSVEESYRVCREIARKQAKNFYYSFVALPPHKRNAICAVYAFMRHADDLSDDETIPLAERRVRMAEWFDAWHRAEAGGATSDPVFIALVDAQARFHIPSGLLDQLVQGTAMDLDRDQPVGGAAHPVQYDTYQTFDDLYHYCYLVASVVGLVCIRIFEYSDPHAEKLAEETGIAFQLTNILRDVSEDAARNRVYLPLTDLAAHKVSLQSLLHRPPSAPPTPAERALLASIAERAEVYYRCADELLPLIDRESRPALWVLVSIYHALLKRIERADYDVFTHRASVPTAQKIAILLVGLARTTWARAFK
jgi:phytoene synthase